MPGRHMPPQPTCDDTDTEARRQSPLIVNMNTYLCGISEFIFFADWR